MTEVETKEWYKCWFDSPYYDILYKDSDQQEADIFIRNLIEFLNPAANSMMLDLACGKGRHAISLSNMGFNITGIDLSEKNILAAKKYENKKLSFYIHDMRKPFMVNYYDMVLNLFTSFGYFENERENNAIIHNIYNALKPGGIFVLDFVNIEKAVQCLTPYEEKDMEGIKFQVKRRIGQRFLIKEIHVIDGALHYDFEEKVNMFTAPMLKKLIENMGFEIVKIAGSHALSEFDNAVSERFIVISKKK